MSTAQTPAAPDNEPERPRSTLSSRLALWLVAVGLGLLFLPLYMISTTVQEENATLSTLLAEIDATLSITPPPDPREDALQSTLVEVQIRANALGALEPTLDGHIDWGAALADIGYYDPAQITLNSAAQAGHQITLSGQAGSESAVIAYTDGLRTSEKFGRVILQSITTKTLPTPTPAPEATPEATPSEKVVEFTIIVELKAN